jgi:hypothetical protein
MASALQVATNVFMSPAQAFAQIKERPSPWFPLALLLVGYSVTSFVYLHRVDLAWFMDLQMQNAPNLTEEQREQAVEGALRISPTTYGAIGAITTSVSVLAIFALIALYYTGVSFATNTGIKYKQWFGLIAWCTLPAAFGLLATIVNLLVSDVRFLPQDALNPLSFGNLLAIDGTGVPTLQRILLSLDPTTIWALVLTILGYQAWTNRSLVHATLVVLGPLAVIVLLGALATL